MNLPSKEKIVLLSKEIVREVHLKNVINTGIQIATYSAMTFTDAGTKSWIAAELQRWKHVHDNAQWLMRNNAHYAIVQGILEREFTNGRKSLLIHTEPD